MLDLLVHCHEFDRFTAAPRYAARLAGALGAALTGLYTAPPLPALADTPETEALNAEFFAYASDEIERAGQAGHGFAAFAAACGASGARWQVALGTLAASLVAAANWNDWIVLEHRDRVPQECVPAIARALLSGAPCLVLREGSEPPAQPRCVAIAWNGSPEAIRAVKAALPLLRLAQRVCVLSVYAPVMRHSRIVCEPEFALEPFLAAHGVNAQTALLEPNPRPIEESILVGCAQAGADLLVMGAFGSSRLHAHDARGVTQFLLEHGGVPLFLRH